MIAGIGDMLFSIYSQTCKWDRSKSFFGEPLKHVITVRGQILVSRTDDDPLWIQNVPVCTGTTRTCFNTCALGAGIHGGVLEAKYGFFPRFFSVPQLTHQTHTTTTNNTTTTMRHTTQHNTQHHTGTERDRERETEKEREEKRREEKRRGEERRGEERRREKREEERREKREERREKRRRDKREEKKRK